LDPIATKSVAIVLAVAGPLHHIAPALGGRGVTKVLPVVLVAVTALITTAIVEAFYALLYLWHAASGSTPSSYDWAGSLSVSGIATAAVLLVGVLAQRLLVGRSIELAVGEGMQPATDTQPAATGAACARE
jgi:hypothetical protein